MPFYTYIKQDGFPDIVEWELPKQFIKDNEYFLLSVTNERPDFGMQRYVNGKWVWGMDVPEEEFKRRREMSVVKLMEDLYEDMKSGDLPKGKKFFNRMDALYKKFPKP